VKSISYKNFANGFNSVASLETSYLNNENFIAFSKKWHYVLRWGPTLLIPLAEKYIHPWFIRQPGGSFKFISERKILWVSVAEHMRCKGLLMNLMCTPRACYNSVIACVWPKKYTQKMQQKKL